MHEYGLMQNVLENVQAQLREHPLAAGEVPVQVRMTIGALEIHSEESFRAAFEILTQETPGMEGLSLDLNIHLGHIECSCGFMGVVPPDAGDPHDATPVTPCPECGAMVNILDGRGVRQIELITDQA